MTDLGQLLKEARKEKGITLEQLEETTKIRRRYLEAIEEGDYHVLPGNFYVRAFIKSYAEAVGLDPNEVLRMYRNVIPATDLEPEIQPIRRPRGNDNNAEKVMKWASHLLVWLFPLFIIGVIYYFINASSEVKPRIQEEPPITDRMEQKPEETENLALPTPETNTPPEEENEAEPPQPDLVFVSEDDTTYIYNAVNSDKVKIEMKVTGDRCWVLLREENQSGAEIHQQEFSQDQEASWESDKSLWLRLGKPGAVELKVNGIVLDDEKLKGSSPWNVQINLVSSENNSQT